MVAPALFSSATIEWATPEHFFEVLNQEFHFTVDVCATSQNAKCARFFTEADNGLAQSWAGVWWCNPPYGRAIRDWTSKAALEAPHSTGVMLLPARTDTQWFHQDVVPNASELRFVSGRLHFGGSPNPAPFPSLVAVFNGPRAKNSWPILSTMRAGPVVGKPPTTKPSGVVSNEDVRLVAEAARRGSAQADVFLALLSEERKAP